MKKYPNINAEFVEIDQFQWGEALMNFAATGTLPDVFGVFSVTEAVMNEWVLPLDDLFDAEPDTNQLSPAFANAKIGGVRYHMPTVMFPHIMYINKTYFERYNVPLPSYDWTTEDFFKLAPELTHPEEFYFGTSNPIYEDLFPSWFNGGQGKWGYDGENYNFDQVWVDAMTLRYDWIEKDVIEWEGPEDKEKFLGDPEAWPPGWGRTAMHIEWPWSFAYWTDVVSVQSGCEFLFYPMPKGPTNDQLMIVDAAVISLNTKYPREAWELLKDTCWGIDANLVRQQSYRDTGVSVSRMPVNSSQVLWDDLMDHANDNLKETYKRIQACNFVPSNWTYSPAWGELEAWINEQDIYGRMERREISPADVAPEMHAKARELKDAWLANNPYN
jgi:multiple sugar transport system substrate-binding protein